MGHLLGDCPKLADLYSYFQATYIGFYRHGRLERAPTFNVSLWNMCQRIKENQPRTDNKHEAWHKSFADCFNETKPSLFTCINALKSEQYQMEIRVADFEAAKDVTRAAEGKYLYATKILSRFVMLVAWRSLIDLRITTKYSRSLHLAARMTWRDVVRSFAGISLVTCRPNSS